MPIRYIAQDPTHRMEWQVIDFDSKNLEDMASRGIIFFAMDKDGNRTQIDVSEVKPISKVNGSYTLVQPVYVDDRIEAVIDVFDALDATLFPAEIQIDENGISQTAKETPSFKDALDKLKKLVRKEE